MSQEAISTTCPESVIVSAVIVYVILDLRSSPDHLRGDAVETFLRREDAERFIEEVRGDDAELANTRRATVEPMATTLNPALIALVEKLGAALRGKAKPTQTPTEEERRLDMLQDDDGSGVVDDD